MKKGIYILSFLLVSLSLATQLVADAFFAGPVIEIVDTEDAEQETDSQKDIEKEKLFYYAAPSLQPNNSDISYISLNDTITLICHSDKDIIPPDHIG